MILFEPVNLFFGRLFISNLSDPRTQLPAFVYHESDAAAQACSNQRSERPATLGDPEGVRYRGCHGGIHLEFQVNDEGSQQSPFLKSLF
jgi:hypothetical protein